MKRQRKKEKKPTNKKKILTVICGIIGAVIVFAAALVIALNPGKGIARGVRADGINIGGKTLENAKQAIMAEDNLKGQEFVLKDNGSDEEKKFSAEEVSLCYDAEKTVEEAYKIGRGEGLIKDAVSLVKLIFSPIDIPCSYSYDGEALQKVLYDFGVSVNGAQKNYELEFGEGTVKVKKGASGQSEDVKDLEDTFLDALQNGEREVFLNLEIKDAPEPDAESLYAEIYVEPQDATYEIKDGKITITPEVLGREISKDEAQKQIEIIKNGGTATLKLIDVAPKVTEASINTELFGTVLGKYSTSYATSTKNRSDNVELAARKINGIILMPGDEFSYNNAVGQRTAANGFKEAPVFENGETVQGMGGGVCQVSSTLYSAVLYADLPVLERQNHSMTVSYVPKGQDATVAYGSIDFRFKNDTKGPIRIAATTGGKKIEIAILGAKPEKEKKVEIINSVVTTVAPTMEKVEDSSLKAGESKTISTGKTGYTVATVRKVYENGKEVKSEKMPSSKYKMIPTKVAVGPESVAAFEETEGNDTEKEGEKVSPKTEEKAEEKVEEKVEDKTEKTEEKTEKKAIERPKANEPSEE